MKNLLASSILILFLVTTINCHKKEYDVIRKTSSKKLIPPGTIWLRDNLYMDETEVSNFHWLEYSYSERQHHPMQYPATLPDTLVWQNSFPYYNYRYPYALYYLKHPAYRDYPAVGISYQQALDYCKWRTDVVNQYLYYKEHKNHPSSLNDTTHYPVKVRYRLPTAEEWEYAAKAGLDICEYPYGYEKLLDENNLPVSLTMEFYNLSKQHLSFVKDSCTASENGPFPQPVFSGKPNKYGYRNMLGNVAELVADTMIKGLSHVQYLDGHFPEDFNLIYIVQTPTERTVEQKKHDYPFEREYSVESARTYTKPEKWLGFRCICEVLE